MDAAIHSLDFYSTFYSDVAKSSGIIRAEQSILLNFSEYEIAYLFGESKVIRKMIIEDFEKTDTFYLQNIVLEAKKEEEMSLIPNRHIKINWTRNGIPQSISIAKEYSAEDLMKLEYGNKHQ